MAKTGKYGHGADGRTPARRAAAQGYDYCIVAENIAYQYRSDGFDSAASLAAAFVEGWEQSPEHRRNMLDAAVSATGVGVAQGPQGRYFGVQMFGRPKREAIRFSVRNRSGEAVRYKVGGRSYSLGARVTRTHTLCRPSRLEIESRGFSAPVEDGRVYGVGEQRVESIRR